MVAVVGAYRGVMFLYDSRNGISRSLRVGGRSQNYVKDV